MPGFQEFVLPFGGNTSVNYAGAAAPAYAQMQQSFPAALANMYGSAGQAFTGYGQALAGLGNTYGQNYGSYAGAMGNMAQAYANQASNRYSSNAMAEAARQGAIGNIGSSALGAFGNIGGQALQAWAQNQASYNNALQNMYGANQASMSQLGQSRNAALAGLGNSYASAAGSLAPSTVASNLAFNFSDSGGGGFGGSGYSATGPGGPISSGSYGGGAGGGGMTFTGSRTNNPGNLQPIIDATYGGIGKAMDGVNDNSYLGALQNSGAAGMQQLDNQHYSSRMMPSQMMSQGLQGLGMLGSQAYGQTNGGMDQFYANQDRAFSPSYFGTFSDALTRGYGDSNRNVGGLAGNLNSGWRDNRSQFDAGMQNLGSMYGDQQLAGNSAYQDLANQKLAAQKALAGMNASPFQGLYSGNGALSSTKSSLQKKVQGLQSLMDQWQGSPASKWATAQYA